MTGQRGPAALVDNEVRRSRLTLTLTTRSPPLKLPSYPNPPSRCRHEHGNGGGGGSSCTGERVFYSRILSHGDEVRESATVI